MRFLGLFLLLWSLAFVLRKLYHWFPARSILRFLHAYWLLLLAVLFRSTAAAFLFVRSHLRKVGQWLLIHFIFRLLHGTWLFVLALRSALSRDILAFRCHDFAAVLRFLRKFINGLCVLICLLLLFSYVWLFLFLIASGQWVLGTGLLLLVVSLLLLLKRRASIIYAGGDFLCFVLFVFSFIWGPQIATLHFLLSLFGLALIGLLFQRKSSQPWRVVLNSFIFVHYIFRMSTYHALSACISFYVFIHCLRRNNQRGLWALFGLWWTFGFCLYLSAWFGIFKLPVVAFYPLLSYLCFQSEAFHISSFRARSFAQNTSFFLALTLLLNLLHFIHGLDPWEQHLILSQDSVKPVFLYSVFHPTFHGQRARYAFESCDGRSLFIGSDIGKKQLLKISLKTSRVEDTLLGHKAGAVSYLDCKTGFLYYPSHSLPGGLMLNEKKISSPIRIFRCPCKHGVDQFFLSGKRGVMWEDRGEIRIFDDSGYLLRVLPGGSLILWEPQWAFFLVRYGPTLYRYDISQDKLRPLVKLGFYSSLSPMSYDGKENKLFLASLWEGNLMFFDVNKRKMEANLYLEPFVRFLTYDPKRNMVYAAGYWRGNLYAVDVKTKRIAGRVYIGRRSHTMYLSQDQNRLYVATSQGVMAVELDKMLEKL